MREQRERSTPWLIDDLTPSTTITHFYDSLYRRTDLLCSNGFEYHYPYDAAGNRLTQTTCAPHGPRGVTTYEHDALGRTLSTTVNAPASPLTTCIFLDKLGNATDRLDPKGIDTRYEYDQLNPLTAVVENYRPAAFLPNANTNVRTEYRYNAQGNRVAIKDGNQHETMFGYDALGRHQTRAWKRSIIS